MGKTISISLFIFAATIFSVTCIPFDGFRVDKTPDLVCANGVYGPNPDVAAKLKICKDPSVYGPGPDKKSPGCSYFCMAKSLNLLGPDGLPHPDISNSWVTSDFPQQYQQLAMDHIRNCYTQYGSMIDLNDEKCSMAGAYNKCFWELQPKLTC